MLTLSSIKNATSKYYLIDDYYLSEVGAKEVSVWWGKGAKQLGLEGKVTENVLDKVFEGELPNGDIIGFRKDSENKHRAGYDLCFHAPKSVSLLALVGGDKRLLNAHAEAVKETLEIIERDCAKAKVCKNGEVVIEKTGNLIVGLMKHITSRKVDPQLHTHALVMNATQRTDGKWRALASSKNTGEKKDGFMENVYDRQIYYGMLFKTFLADKVKDLGFEIETVGKHGLWEIKGIPKAVIELMSKRTKDIEEKAGKLNYKTPKAKDIIAKYSREAKLKDLKLDQLQSYWKKELESIGFNVQEYLVKFEEELKTRGKKDRPANFSEITAAIALKDAIAHISQQDLQLDYAKVISKAIEFTIGECKHSDITSAFEKLITDGKLIQLDKLGTLFVTQDLIETEKILMDYVEKSKNKASPIANTFEVLNKIEKNEELNKNSLKAQAMDILQNQDAISLVEHNHLNNELISALLHIAEAGGKNVRILSPNQIIVNELNEEVKRDKPTNIWQWLRSLGKPEVSNSIGSFIYKYQKELDNTLFNFNKGKDVIIVDSAEVVGCSDIQKLCQLAEQTNARLIFLRNIEEKSGFKPGNSVQTLKQAGVQTFTVTKGVKENTFTPNLVTIKDEQKRLQQFAKNYAEKINDREDVLAIVGSKSKLKEANEAIREELKNLGKISHHEQTVTVLNPIYLSQSQGTIASQYRKGMIVRFFNKSGTEDWEIINIDSRRNFLTICSQADRQLYDVLGRIADKLGLKPRIKSFNPKEMQNKFSLFEREELKVAVGDKLITTAKMPTYKLKAGEKLTVTEVTDKVIKLSNNSTTHCIRLNGIESAHFQYDYATTLNKTTKKSRTHVIANIKAYALEKPIIDGLSNRAKSSLTVFTNDSKVAEQRFGLTKVKSTAVDTILTTANVARMIDNTTVEEIKKDIEAALQVLRPHEDRIERKAIEFALEKITSRNAGFLHRELVTTALEFALVNNKKTHTEEKHEKQRTSTHEKILGILEEKRKSGELIMGKSFEEGTYWTTKETLDLERNILSILKSGKGQVEQLLSEEAYKEKIQQSGFPLTKDQKNACHLITTTADKFIIIQGYAGTGKTTMFSQIKNMVEQNTQIVGLAPTHAAAKELIAAGIPTQTLKSFLVLKVEEQNKLINIESKGKTLLILDESSMISNKDWADFVMLINYYDCHVVFAGDRTQYPSIESGDPFGMIQKSNILETVILEERVRQKNPNLKEMVGYVINKDYDNAFKKMEAENPNDHIERQENYNSEVLELIKNHGKSIIEIDNNKSEQNEGSSKTKTNNNEFEEHGVSLEQAVAEDFLSRTKAAKDNTVIISYAHKDRHVINNLIREGLKKQGEIAEKELHLTRLFQKGLTKAEHKLMVSYEVGNVITFNNRDYYLVIDKDDEARSLLLKSYADGTTKYFFPEKYSGRYKIMEIYSSTGGKLAVGDVIRFTKTDKGQKRYANFEYKVIETTNNHITLASRDDESTTITLTPEEIRDSHWDYAQTVTGHCVQGASRRNTIQHQLSHRENLATQRGFEVGSTRAKEHTILYTDNKNRLLKKIKENTGDKYSGLEVIGEIPMDVPKARTKSEAKKTQTTYSSPNPKPDFKKNKEHKSEYSQNKNYVNYDAKEITRGLNEITETIIESMYGKPNPKLSSNNEWRYGNKGSFSIKITGDKRGLWHNFETGESGNLLSLIQKEKGLSFQEALKYAAENLLTYHNFSHTDNKNNKDKNPVKVEEPKNDKTKKYGKELVETSLPISGTIVEKYLKEVRNIKNIDAKDIRFHPHVYTNKNEKHKYLPAMLVIGRDKNGNIQCVQVTYLDPDTSHKADISTKKRTYGSPKGNSVYLLNNKSSNDRNDRITCLVEGVETGLSVRDAAKNVDVIVTLGKSNFLHIAPENIGKKVIFCLDNDGLKMFGDNIIDQTAERLIQAGKEVYIALPNQIENTKTDFNDVAAKKGLSEVKDTLNNAIPYQKWKKDAEYNMEETLMKSNLNTFLKIENNTQNITINPTKGMEKTLNFESKNSNNELQKTTNQEQMQRAKTMEVKQNTQKELIKVEKEIY